MWAAWEGAFLWEKWLSSAWTVAEGADCCRQSINRLLAAGQHRAVKGTHISFYHRVLMTVQRAFQGKNCCNLYPSLAPVWLPTGKLVLWFLFWYFLVVTPRALDHIFLPSIFLVMVRFHAIKHGFGGIEACQEIKMVKYLGRREGWTTIRSISNLSLHLPLPCAFLCPQGLAQSKYLRNIYWPLTWKISIWLTFSPPSLKYL